MIFQEYLKWRGENLSDQMIDAGNFDLFSLSDSKKFSNLHVAQEDVLEKWSGLAGFELDYNGVLISTGIRDIFKSIVAVLFKGLDEVWIPSDVYPAYSTLFSHERVRRFNIIDLQLDHINGSSENGALLLPNPLHPVGRYLEKPEKQKLVNWLNQSQNRWLLIDAVYDFEGVSSKFHDRCIIMRSMSKSWLCRRMFGVAELPTSLLDQIVAPIPSIEQLSYCYITMCEQEGRSFDLAASFQKSWGMLEKSFKTIGMTIDIPDTGYLAVLNCSYDKLFQNNILAAPVSVFGSSRSDLSVISCLGV